MKDIDIFTVADWFLAKSGMEHKKLQTLCYYAQAWHCALEGNPLFSETPEAWVHVPVFRSLYQKYKDYSGQKIPKGSFNNSPLPENTLEVLNAVYNTYGNLSGDQLEALIHSEEPYLKAKGKLPPFEPSTNHISVQDMKKFYSRLYQEAQND